MGLQKEQRCTYRGRGVRPGGRCTRLATSAHTVGEGKRSVVLSESEGIASFDIQVVYRCDHHPAPAGAIETEELRPHQVAVSRAKKGEHTQRKRPKRPRKARLLRRWKREAA